MPEQSHFPAFTPRRLDSFRIPDGEILHGMVLDSHRLFGERDAGALSPCRSRFSTAQDWVQVDEKIDLALLISSASY
jgi:hypothetical protein